MSATVFVEKSSAVRVTIENHFWNVIFDMVCKNCFVDIFVSGMFEISNGMAGGISIFCGCICKSANLASNVKSFVLRLMTSFLNIWFQFLID